MNKVALATLRCIACLFPLVSVAQGLGPAEPYNVLVFDNFEATSSTVEGRIAAGGNLSLNHYSVGNGLSNVDTGVALVAGGDIIFPSGSVDRGDILAGGSIGGIGQSVIYGLADGTVVEGNAELPLSFTEAQAELEQMSNSLAELPANGQVTFQWGGLYMTAACDAPLQVFHLNGEQVQQAHTFSVDRGCAPDDATYLFNISGTHPGLSNMSLSHFSDIADRVLYHFPNAETLSLQGIGVQGSILAPKAVISQPQGSIRGQLVARSWIGGLSFQWLPFNGELGISTEPVDTTPPSVAAPADLTVEASAVLTPVNLGTATAEDDTDGEMTPIADVTGPFSLGSHTITWSATDTAGNTGTATQTVTVRDTTPPSLTLPDNIITVSNEPVAVNLGQATTSDLFGPVTLTNDAPTLFPVGETQVIWTATDANGNSSTYSQWVIVEQPDDPVGELPPDPKDVAPPLENGSASLKDQTSFLYSGSNPIQTGVAENTIVESRAAVIRGRVLDRSNAPLSGVQVTIKGHNEFGQTLSRADGNFDMAVNGGGMLVIDYQKEGYLPVQRQVRPQWNDYAFAEDIVMIQLDPQVTTVQLGNGEAMQVAQGSPQTDADGTRQATLLFPQGTTATMTLPDGSTQALTTLNVRATEYTVGDNGFEAMPGALPPTSAYTYAVELSVDEAMAAGSSRVDFNQPVPLYVDNFLNFPIGEIVPAGYYDHEDAIWKAGDNGRVIEILTIESGKAILDVEGEGSIATDTELQALGINEAELQKLASLYAAGKTLWRTPISHFTPWDCNWPYGPPLDAEVPNVDVPETPNKDEPKNSDEECNKPGCVISAQRQTLGENLPVAGTPFELIYRSDRTPGYKNNVAQITLSGDTVSANLERIRLDVNIAGQRISRTFSGEPNLTYSFDWNGLDGYGRAVQGVHDAKITISYQYACIYYSASSEFEEAWAQVGDTSRIIGSRGDSCSVAMSRRQTVALASPNKARPESAGAWSLSIHHAYDAMADVLILGNGTRRTLGLGVIQTVAGIGGRSGAGSASGDGGLAIDAQLNFPIRVTVDAEGSLYISTSGTLNHQVRRVDPDGIITLVAGEGLAGFSGDGGLATDANMKNPLGVAVDATGNLYIADSYNNRIRRVSPDGIIDTVAGTGELTNEEGDRVTFSGDGGPATEARLYRPSDVEVDTNGNLYIADFGNNRIRRVSPEGIIETVAGSGSQGFSGDGGPATRAQLDHPSSVAVDFVGNLYFTDSHNSRVRKVTPSGIIETVAGSGDGNGSYGFSGDGGPATEAELSWLEDLAVDYAGNLYIADLQNHRVRRVDPDGIIDTVAGNGDRGSTGDGGPATSATWTDPSGVAVDAEGNLYSASAWENKVRKVSFLQRPGVMSGTVGLASADGSQLYSFDDDGRHVRTTDTVSGSTLYTFEYDTGGLLSAVTDGNGNVTSFERDSTGNAIAIVAPDGQRTELIMDGNGHLIGLSNTAGQYWSMSYTDDGLLTRFENLNGHVNTFSYDANGRLIRDEAPNGGGWTINRTDMDNGYRTNMISGEGRISSFLVSREAGGQRIYRDQGPSGSITERIHTFGSTKVLSPNGTQVVSEQGPDPRFGMLAPVTTERRVTTPSGLELLQTTERTVSLEDPQDRLSHTALATTVTINDRAQTAVYDAASRTWAHASPEGRSLVQYLNEMGFLSKVQVPGIAETRYKYDERGRLTQIDRGYDTERPIQFGYDGFGYLNTLTDAQGKTINYVNDAVGKVLQQTRFDGSVVSYDYDPNGNLTEIRLPNGETHQFQYTSVDQQEVYSPPNPADSSTDAPVGSGHPTTQYQYNKDKQLEAIVRPDGVVVDYVYNDTTGQLTDLITPTGTYEYDYYGEFDPIHSGQLKTVTAPGGQQTSYEYDGFLLTDTDWSGPISGTLGYEYNNYFEPVSQSLNGEALSLAYNDDGQLTQAGDMSIQYVAENGLLDQTTLGNVDTDYAYNNFGELTNYGTDYVGTGLYNYTLNRDEVGRITGKTETLGGSISEYQYLYDNNDRLEQVLENGETVQSWGYDANGNRTHENGVLVAQFDAQDRLTQYKDNEYRYTANGELTEKTDTATNETTQYDYDAFSNLRAVTLPDGTSIEYVIDGQNRRVGKLRNGMLEQGFLYQGQLNPIAELDGNNNITARFVYGDKGHVPSYIIKDGTNYRILSDHLGSVRLVVNASTGEVAQRMDYDAWGNVTNDTNPGFQPFGYAGGIYDRDTNLVRFGARDYDPEIGRWTTKDPIGFQGGLNYYAYVGGDPINFIDPNGLKTEVIIFEGVGWGSSSLGHVATNINGTIYSWGPSGMAVMPHQDYMDRNSFRNAKGLTLNLSPEQEAQLEARLIWQQGKGSYGALGYNCTDPLENGLEELGYGLGVNVTPGSLHESLAANGLIAGEISYGRDPNLSAPGPYDSAPWAGW